VDAILSFSSADAGARSDRTVAPFFPVPRGSDSHQHAALERLRGWLLEAVGCERSLEILLDLAAERLSYEDLAGLLNLTKSRAWNLVQRVHHTIRWAAVAEAVVAALEDSNTCAVEPLSASILPLNEQCRYAVPVAGVQLVLAEVTVEEVRRAVEAQASRLLRQRRRPLHLVGYFDATARAGHTLEGASLCDDLPEARALAARQHQDRVVDLHTGETLTLRQRVRAA